ncbi:hypothetical protein OH76DRAFT_472358 [Lentinus brumalis]|uniref:Uncharacterized protein n=1 Tax=Lentinus brumalis TaxID=2498619 RepID=A0A371DCS0_9APHY|nr:hypothetical protein OH76DRAFT_472358 [Polyporus brumalis]
MCRGACKLQVESSPESEKTSERSRRPELRNRLNADSRRADPEDLLASDHPQGLKFNALRSTIPSLAAQIPRPSSLTLIGTAVLSL